MSDDTAQPARWTSSHHNFLTHLVVMPGWHKAVILLAGALALLGTAGQFAAKSRETPAAQRAVSDPTGSRLVPDSKSPSSATRTEDGGLLIRLSPHAIKVGLSVILGFILGWVFRAFLKTMALLTLLVVGGLWLLSHFGVLHLGAWDVDSVKSKSTEAASWLEQHAQHLKDLALSHLPSAGGGAFGALLGFRRK